MSRFVLTKKRRNQIYESALAIYISKGFTHGLCNAISKAKRYSEPNPYIHSCQYPEIFKHAPKFSERTQDDGYWFPVYDREIRINILTQAINETL